jgi:hypothetical protein
LSVIRKPDAAAPAVGGSHAGPWSATTPEQKALVSLLEMAFGAAEPVAVIIAQALISASRDDLPGSGPDLVAFVRAHLLTTLSDHIGPRLTMALVDDLAAQIDPTGVAPTDPSVPPSSMPRPVARVASRARSSPRVRSERVGVLLVDADRVGRTTLARALLRAQWEVTVVDSRAELDAALESGDPVHVALVDATHAHAQAVVEALARVRPDVAVVARSGDSIRTGALLAHLGVAKFEVRSREAPAEELVDAVRRITS